MSAIDCPIEEIQKRVYALSSQAILNADLSIVFGSNGSGRSAIGNYTLLHRATGLSRAHVSKVLRGITSPSYNTLMRLSDATGISLDEISKYIQDQKLKEAA